MKKFIYLIIFLLPSSEYLYSQDRVERLRKPIESKVFYFSSGVQLLNVNALNEVLKEANFPKAMELNLGLGSGLGIRTGALLFHLENYGYKSVTPPVQPPGQTREWRIYIRTTGWNISARYDVLDGSDRVNFYPMAGVSLNRLRLEIIPELGEETTFNNFIEPVTRSATRSDIGLHLAAQIEVNFGYTMLNKTQGWLLGARPGYYLPLAPRGWTIGNTRADDGPSLNPGGLYAILLMGVKL